MIKAIFFNAANLLSISRIFLAIPLSISINKININSDLNDVFLFLFICFLVAVSDILDGIVARKFSLVTNLGKVLDPIADKICVLVVITALFSEFYEYFFIFFLLILVRDLIISGMTLYFIRKKNMHFQANMAGKLFLFFIGMTMIFFVIDIPIIINEKFIYLYKIKFFTYYASWFFFSISTYFYFVRYFRIYN